MRQLFQGVTPEPWLQCHVSLKVGLCHVLSRPSPEEHDLRLLRKALFPGRVRHTQCSTLDINESAPLCGTERMEGLNMGPSGGLNMGPSTPPQRRLSAVGVSIRKAAAIQARSRDGFTNRSAVRTPGDRPARRELTPARCSTMAVVRGVVQPRGVRPYKTLGTLTMRNLWRIVQLHPARADTSTPLSYSSRSGVNVRIHVNGERRPAPLTHHMPTTRSPAPSATRAAAVLRGQRRR